MRRLNEIASHISDRKNDFAERVRVRLDTLSQEERLRLVLAMLGIMTALTLLTIGQAICGMTRKERQTIVIEHIDQPLVIGRMKDCQTTKPNENGTEQGNKRSAGRGLGQLIPGGTDE